MRPRLAGAICRNFEEVNLRFYVRHKTNDAWRRGVVFVKELVPRWAIAWVARAVYNENYVAVPMDHCIEHHDPANSSPSRVEYSWRHARCDHLIELTVLGSDMAVTEGSEEEFITEHYWGYCRQRDGGTVEFGSSIHVGGCGVRGTPDTLGTPPCSTGGSLPTSSLVPLGRPSSRTARLSLSIEVCE